MYSQVRYTDRHDERRDERRYDRSRSRDRSRGRDDERRDRSRGRYDERRDRSRSRDRDRDRDDERRRKDKPSNASRKAFSKIVDRFTFAVITNIVVPSIGSQFFHGTARQVRVNPSLSWAAPKATVHDAQIFFKSASRIKGVGLFVGPILLEDDRAQPKIGDIMVGFAIESGAFRKDRERGAERSRKCQQEFDSWIVNGASELFQLASMNQFGVAASAGLDMKELQRKLRVPRAPSTMDELWVTAQALFESPEEVLRSNPTAKTHYATVRDFLRALGESLGESWYASPSVSHGTAPTYGAASTYGAAPTYGSTSYYSNSAAMPYSTPAPAPAPVPAAPAPVGSSLLGEYRPMTPPGTPPGSPKYEPASPVYCPDD